MGISQKILGLMDREAYLKAVKSSLGGAREEMHRTVSRAATEELLMHTFAPGREPTAGVGDIAWVRAVDVEAREAIEAMLHQLDVPATLGAGVPTAEEVGRLHEMALRVAAEVRREVSVSGESTFGGHQARHATQVQHGFPAVLRR